MLAKWARDTQNSVPPADSGRELTRVVIPSDLLCHRVSRMTHWEMYFHLTQLMTGHGCFNRYLWKINRSLSAGCSHMQTTRWLRGGSRRCSPHPHRSLRPGRAGYQGAGVLDSPTNWEAVARFVRAVMSAKEVVERERKFRQGVAPSRRRR